MFLVKLALKNLTRHKRRTLITASVIALGLCIYVVVDSLMMGLEDMSFDNLINLESGHIQVTDREYWEEREQAPLEHLITFDAAVREAVETIPEVQGYTPRLKFMANLNNGMDELPVTVIGIDPAAERDVLQTERYIRDGEMFQAGANAALIGKSLAELMELNVGDYLTLVLKTKDGTYNTIDAAIVGLLQTPHPGINDSTVYVPLDLAQETLNLTGQISEVVIRVDAGRQIDKAVHILNSNLAAVDPKLEAKSWKAGAESLIAMSKAQDVENGIVVSIILIIAGVGIINTIILSALERLEETGMMKAMGMREREIIFVYVAEAIGMGLLGGLIGCVLGAVGVWALTTFGIDLNWFGAAEMDYGIPISGRFFGGWNPGAFVFSFFFGGLVALITGFLPSRWAARKDPIDAIYRR